MGIFAKYKKYKQEKAESKAFNTILEKRAMQEKRKAYEKAYLAEARKDAIRKAKSRFSPIKNDRKSFMARTVKKASNKGGDDLMSFINRF